MIGEVGRSTPNLSPNPNPNPNPNPDPSRAPSPSPTSLGLLSGAYAFSPDGDPSNWRLSPDEAWEDHVSFDDCEGQKVFKRQRPGLVFDNLVLGTPSHLITGKPT